MAQWGQILFEFAFRIYQIFSILIFSTIHSSNFEISRQNNHLLCSWNSKSFLWFAIKTFSLLCAGNLNDSIFMTVWCSNLFCFFIVSRHVIPNDDDICGLISLLFGLIVLHIFVPFQWSEISKTFWYRIFIHLHSSKYFKIHLEYLSKLLYFCSISVIGKMGQWYIVRFSFFRNLCLKDVY